MRFLGVCLAVLLISACANYKTKYNKVGQSWKDSINEMPQTSPQYVLYAIGDAGYLPNGEKSPALVEMQKMALMEDGESGMIFLGDNIYPSGMPKRDDETRKDAEEAIEAQLEVANKFKGDIFFIPGNHDWRQEDAQKGIVRQEKYIEKYLDAKVHYPDDGCSGPDDFKLSDDVRLIVFDSEWYLQDWNQYIDFNEKCDIKTRFDFLFKLTDEIKKAAKDKRLIVAMHHPIYTNGVHGGKFTWKDHLFPLSNFKKPIHVPLPIIGSAYPFLRKNTGISQDINGEFYNELRQFLLTNTDVFNNVIFISGHEHNLQYIFRDDHHHIVSGAGSKQTPVGLGKGAEFAASELGFTRLSVYEKGVTWMEFFSCENDKVERIYAKKITDELTVFDKNIQQYEYPKTNFVEVPISTENTSRSGFSNLLLGKQYGQLYNMPLRAPVTDLTTKQGGLSPLKRGGGFQTNSIRLEDKAGRHWVLRAIRKDPTRLLPDEFSNTVAVKAVDHFLTTAHPLSAYTIPPMAEAIGILHTKPELVYVPKQPALNEFNEDHGGKLYLYEDRPADDRTDRDNFGNSDDIINTLDLIDEMKKDGHDRPMESDVARNRLFDMIIGDWDRHDDQWRWAKFDGKGKFNYYRPVPRDRDQAYAIFEGLLIGVARNFSPGIAKFQTFDDKIKNVKYFNFNARYFDRTFLTELPWQGWEKEIDHIQSNLTDSIIHKGISQMQDDFYTLHGQKIEYNIRSRRDGLRAFAREYYLSLSKHVDVIGSGDDDLIEVIRNPGNTLVRISEVNKKEEIKFTFYERTFFDNETKEVRVYGLDGDDIFKVSGDGSSIKVRMIGGTDDDTFKHDGNSRKNYVYDLPKDTEIDKTSGLKNRICNDYYNNTYDRKAFQYNHAFALPNAGFNPDNGFLLGLTISTTWHGFKKQPYASSHSFTSLYSFETEGFQFKYFGRFVDAIGNWNLRLDGLYQGEFFSNNFFGIGNETVNFDESPFNLGLDFNRVRNTTGIFKLLAEKDLGDNGHFYIGPKFENRQVTFQENRIIGIMYDSDHPVFDDINYYGLETGIQYKNIDNGTIPHKGISIEIIGDYLQAHDESFAVRQNINVDELEKLTLRSDFRIYMALDNHENVIWAHRLGSGFNFIDNVLFYHLQQIGGSYGLRGFRNERFTGNSHIVYNTDVRIRLLDFKSYFAPSTVGIYGGFDIGRVWFDGLNSDTWHVNYGGGLWIAPFDMAVLNLGYFTSADEEGRLVFTLGFGI